MGVIYDLVTPVSLRTPNDILLLTVMTSIISFYIVSAKVNSFWHAHEIYLILKSKILKPRTHSVSGKPRQLITLDP